MKTWRHWGEERQKLVDLLKNFDKDNSGKMPVGRLRQVLEEIDDEIVFYA